MAINNSKKNITVQRVELNGNKVDLSHPFVEYSGNTALIKNNSV